MHLTNTRTSVKAVANLVYVQGMQHLHYCEAGPRNRQRNTLQRLNSFKERPSLVLQLVFAPLYLHITNQQKVARGLETLDLLLGELLLEKELNGMKLIYV